MRWVVTAVRHARNFSDLAALFDENLFIVLLQGPISTHFPGLSKKIYSSTDKTQKQSKVKQFGLFKTSIPLFSRMKKKSTPLATLGTGTS
ncbi:Hypothetical protein NTJ_07167 [Nesidiocoris tenuis]|uniref:Uncharacterized protein n=1 Tax=Nesidiocoris tenuis TaxID=355587 RepID=A0ABN7AR00_9HEMI|nr:Hypothetical protein NTJ_07167 [Nesidiocoris tenuis]